MAGRLFAEIAEKLGHKLPVSLLAEAPTPRLLAGRIRDIQRGRVQCLVPMQTTGARPPLYFIHHLLADILIYRSVANQFAAERPVFGIHPPVDLTERRLPSLHAIAAEYVSEILERQKEGPFHLAGFSSGGVIAFEMARQLAKAGHEVGLLALIDGDTLSQLVGRSLPACENLSRPRRTDLFDARPQTRCLSRFAPIITLFRAIKHLQSIPFNAL